MRTTSAAPSAINRRNSGPIDIAGEIRYECPMSIAVVAVPSTAIDVRSSAIRHAAASAGCAARPPSTKHASRTGGVNQISNLPPGALSRCQTIEPATQQSVAAAQSIQNAAPAAWRKNTAATASRPSATRNCTRKKRGGTIAVGKIGNTTITPQARRRQNVAAISLSGVDQGQELGARRQVRPEDAAHRAGGTDAPRLANA